MRNIWKHLSTIIRHKFYVMIACFRAGIRWQGILHDLSKFGYTELLPSARYFQGTYSPIKAEKIAKGYSFAWQHHKGRNKHHWQYWIDWDGDGKQVLIPMPRKYVVEMICDWIGAGKAYNNGNWDISVLTRWYHSHKHKILLNERTREEIEFLMRYTESEKQLYYALRAYLKYKL